MSQQRRLKSNETSQRLSELLIRLAQQLGRLVARMVVALVHPRMRAVTLGVVLILIGALWIDHSVWTFPLIAVGVILLLASWVGARMRGHLNISWGEGATSVDLQASLQSAVRAAADRSARDTDPASDAATSDVLDGEAHTMELDGELLQRIVAAIEDHDAHILAAHPDTSEHAVAGEAIHVTSHNAVDTVNTGQKG